MRPEVWEFVLYLLSAHIRKRALRGETAVLACSALKAAYRARLGRSVAKGQLAEVRLIDDAYRPLSPHEAASLLTTLPFILSPSLKLPLSQTRDPHPLLSLYFILSPQRCSSSPRWMFCGAVLRLGPTSCPRRCCNRSSPRSSHPRRAASPSAAGLHCQKRRARSSPAKPLGF